MAAKKNKQSAQRRRVFVNGVYCETLTDAAAFAGAALGRKVQVYEIQRVVDGKTKIGGLDVVEALSYEVARNEYVEKKHVAGTPLLIFPLGKRLLERGLPEVWR